MLTGGLSERYARALIEAAGDDADARRAAGEVGDFARLCAERRDLAAGIGSPAVTVPVKKRIIACLLDGRAGRLAINFLCMLVERRRIALLPEISAALDEMILALSGVKRVLVVSAMPIVGGQAALAGRLEKWLGAKVLLEIRHDPGLLCGIQIRVGEMLYDGSGRGVLDRIRARFANN